MMTDNPPKPIKKHMGIHVINHRHSQPIDTEDSLLAPRSSLRGHIANFNHKRTPERQPNAHNRSGAFGHFQVTCDVTQYTKASIFQPHVKTEVLTRFSTEADDHGSPEAWRAPRDFSVKFYSPEGNYDILGNNIPVFFARDPLTFQQFIRSQKKRAGSYLCDPDMLWYFWTLSPESAHQVTILMSDRGISKSWRQMNGYSSHTHMWINCEGEKFWVKYHFKTNQGVENFTQHEANKIALNETEYYLEDLFASIEQNQYPSWRLEVQVMPFADAETYRFNPFDLTKVWPHDDYPPLEVGKLELNRNPTDVPTQIEQVPFETKNMIAGIGPSPDKMLRDRMFAYADAHRARLGANNQLIPVVKPEYPIYNRSNEGIMRMPSISEPVSAPNSKHWPSARESQVVDWGAEGQTVRQAYALHKDDDDFGQANTLVNKVMNHAERERLASNVISHLANGVSEEVLERAYCYWKSIDRRIGEKIEAGMKKKPALRMKTL